MLCPTGCTLINKCSIILIGYLTTKILLMKLAINNGTKMHRKHHFYVIESLLFFSGHSILIKIRLVIDDLKVFFGNVVSFINDNLNRIYLISLVRRKSVFI